MNPKKDFSFSWYRFRHIAELKGIGCFRNNRDRFQDRLHSSTNQFEKHVRLLFPVERVCFSYRILDPTSRKEPPEDLMPVSIRKYTELKLAISDYLQRRNWTRLFELCGTSDDETAKTIAVIMTFYDPARLWNFLDFVYRMSAEERKGRRDSVATCCYLLGKIGQARTEKTLNHLRHFLLDDHMLRGAVTAALSNLWVLDTKKTARIILNQWILKGAESDDLPEVGIRAIEYLAKNSPSTASSFLLKVASLGDEHKIATRAAKEILEEIGISSKGKNVEKVVPRMRKKARK